MIAAIRVGEARKNDMGPVRRFAAHCSNESEHKSPFVAEAVSFEEAALLYAERWSGADDACRVMVVEQETGERRCFVLHLDSGSATPC